MTAYQPDGVELWRGPSAIDGAEVGVVVTHIRHDPMNRKIGAMAQAWVLPRSTPPLDAVRTGADASVCGSCRFRPYRGGGCYVSIPHTAQRVWWAWHRSYLPAAELPAELAGRPIRIGAWGDPAAAPVEVWLGLTAAVPAWTAYTHRWRELGRDPSWQRIAMASVDSAAEAAEARQLGWRTFRARLPGQPLLAGERICPSADEAPTHGRVTCATCRLCDGTTGRIRPDVAIVVHGVNARAAARWMAPNQLELALAEAK